MSDMELGLFNRWVRGQDPLEDAHGNRVPEVVLQEEAPLSWHLTAADKQRMLSNGIAEAMYNTAFGLGIAVICMIAHVFLNTRSKNIQHDLESTMERVFNLLTVTSKTGY